MDKKVDWILGAGLGLVAALAPRRLLGSLSWHVQGFVRHWQANSTDLRKHRWHERALLDATTHPWIAVGVSLCLWAVVSAAMLYLAECGCLSLEKLDKSDLPTYFGTAWSVQATVVALVYPLVISFVALLLQRRATAKVALTAYLLETGVKPSGTSSFTLLVLMTLQYLAMPWLSVRHMQAMMISDITWLAVNLVLTGWFLARTAYYLQDERRVETLLWLTQSITLPREVWTYGRGLLLQNAQKEGWVPKTELLSETSKPKVLVFPMGEGRPVMQRQFSTPRDLRDVHFRLLSWAIVRWMAAQSVVEDRHPLLELPSTPGDADKVHVLCRVRDAEPPDRLARAAIRASYRFARPALSAMPFSSVDVMEELAQEAASQIVQRREPEFRQALNDLAEVHIGLLRAARFRTQEGTPDSVCLLQDPYGWGSRAMCRDWMEPYRAIVEEAVAALEDSDRFFRRTAAISMRLTREAGDQPPAVLIDLLLSSTLLMHHLSLWWTHRAASDAAPSVHAARLLSPPLRNVYSEALRIWVGSWESVDVRIDKDADLHGAALWHAQVARIKAYAAHIDETARLMLGAVARGDAEAARRLEDVLVKWWGNRQHELGVDQLLSQPEWGLLTLAFADQGWEEARVKIPGLPEGSQAEEVSARLLVVLLHRYWSDVCLVTSLVLLDYATTIEHPLDSLCLEIVGALMNGSGYDRTAVIDADQYRHAGMAIAMLTRMQVAEQTYTNRLDHVVQAFRSDTRGPMISGRVYALGGADDVRSLVRGHAIYIAVLVAGQTDNLGAFKRIVETWRTDLKRLDRIAYRFNNLAAACRDGSLTPHLAVVEKVRGSLERVGSADEALAQAAALCQEAATIASTAQQVAIADAPLSPQRLKDLAQQVHERIFSAQRPMFPVGATAAFLATDDALEVRAQGFTGIPKLPFTQPQLEPLDDHLVHLFSQHTAQLMCAVALSKLQRKHGIEAVRDDRADAFYADLKLKLEAVVAQGGTPVILVAAGQASYLSPYRLPEDGAVPADLDIRPPTELKRGLHATVNDVEVYAVPMAPSRYMVLPSEWLGTLRYRKLEEGAAVSVKVENEADGKLDIAFEFGCEFAPPAIA